MGRPAFDVASLKNGELPTVETAVNTQLGREVAERRDVALVQAQGDRVHPSMLGAAGRMSAVTTHKSSINRL